MGTPYDPQMQMNSDRLSMRQVARRLGVSPQTARSWTKAGHFGFYLRHPGIKGKPQYAVLETAVDAYVRGVSVRPVDIESVLRSRPL